MSEEFEAKMTCAVLIASVEYTVRHVSVTVWCGLHVALRQDPAVMRIRNEWQGLYSFDGMSHVMREVLDLTCHRTAYLTRQL